MGGEDKHSNGELSHRAVDYADATVSIVRHSDIAEVVRVRTGLEELTVTVDRVTIQIECDVVGSDDDAIIRAVGEIVGERRVGGDRVATSDNNAGRGRPAIDQDDAREHQTKGGAE